MNSYSNYTFDIKVCRLCLIKKDDMIHIFDNENKNSTSLPTKIMTCVSIEISDGDGLPYLICHQCAFQIDSWYKFKIQCQSTDATLREYLDKQSALNGKFDEPNHLSSTYEESDARLKMTFRSRKRILEPLSKSNEVPSAAENKSSGTKPLLNSLNELDKKEISVYPSLPPDVQLDIKYTVKPEENSEIMQKDTEEENIFPIVKTFSCKVCQKSFASSYYLQDHESIHYREEDFYCSECGKVFFSKHKLVVHLKTHSAERPFLCSMCGKAYRKKFELQKHFLMHSDESPYLCNVCDDVSNEMGLSQAGETSEDTKGDNNWWSHNAVLQLIENYRNNMESFFSSAVRNEVVWKRISIQLQSEGFNYTAKQCENKFKNLKKRYTKLNIMKSSQSGAGHFRFEYFEQFNELFGKKPNVVPFAIASSSRVSSIEEENTSTIREVFDSPDEKDVNIVNNTTENSKRKLPLMKRSTKKTKFDMMMSQLQEIREKNEKGRENRHAELMNLHREAVQIFNDKMDKFIEKL